MRIVTNDIRDGHRWMNRERRDHGRERPIPADSVLHLDGPARPVTRPSQKIDREERKAWVRLALELLGATDRDIIQLRQWEKVSFGEIGERLGINEDAARMRHGRALKKLAEKVMSLRGGAVQRCLEEDEV